MTEEIWLEKYRPITLDEVQGNIEAVNHIREFARKGNIPNVILAVHYLILGTTWYRKDLIYFMSCQTFIKRHLPIGCH